MADTRMKSEGKAAERFRLFFLAAIMMLACFAHANAADLNGKWKGELQSPNGALEINFDFTLTARS